MTLNHEKRPEITVFAGPNGSGKSTIKERSPHACSIYVNADEIKKAIHCSDMEAAQRAELLRNQYVEKGVSFSFETVLSTPRNLDLLKAAKEKGYFIRGIFVLTADVELNVNRVKFRVIHGGHDVPVGKIRTRYLKSLANVPEFVDLCDVCHVYDTTGKELRRIFKKKRNEITYETTQYWKRKGIEKLVGISLKKN